MSSSSSSLEDVTTVPDPPSRGVPLRDRPVSATEVPRPRHCWVTGPSDAPGPWPGLVLDRRRGQQGWQGLVIYAVTAESDVTLVQQWVSAELIKLGT